MANLNGQYLDSLTLYKGLINIGSTVGQNVTSSLQSLTDGDGNNLPIQISTTQVIIGGGSSLGRLVVRGDGINPIILFRSSSGTTVASVNNLGYLEVTRTAPGDCASFTGGVRIWIINSTNNGAAITSQANGTGNGIGHGATGVYLLSSSTIRLTVKTSGVINIASMPTSTTGLVAGDLWNNSGVVNIV